jgi:hypothetical protein
MNIFSKDNSSVNKNQKFDNYAKRISIFDLNKIKCSDRFLISLSTYIKNIHTHIGKKKN